MGKSKINTGLQRNLVYLEMIHKGILAGGKNDRRTYRSMMYLADRLDMKSFVPALVQLIQKYTENGMSKGDIIKLLSFDAKAVADEKHPERKMAIERLINHIRCVDVDRVIVIEDMKQLQKWKIAGFMDLASIFDDNIVPGTEC